MHRKLILALSFLILGVFLFSCAESGTEPSVGPSAAYELSVTGKVTVNGSTPNSQLSVEVVSISPEGKVIEKKQSQTAFSSSQPTVNGSFSVSIKAVPKGKIVVTAYGPGYTQAVKTLVNKGGKNLSVNLDLQSATTQTVNINNGIVISSSGRKYVRIAFAKDNNGNLKPITGLSAMSSNSKVIDIGIPLEALQSNTLTVSYKDYQPSNPDDYKNFPGEETERGERLVSIGFDYLDIRDESGNNPFTQGINAWLVQGEYYRILRWIDCQQINNIRNTLGSLDEDPNKPGIQLTFYAFDTDRGVWVEAGKGTFVDNSTIDFMNQEWDYIVQNGCNPNSTSNNNNDSDPGCSEYGIFTDENSICADSNDFVVISVTNPQLQWKNLDYVVPEGGIVSCDIRVLDEDGNPISGAWVSAFSDVGCMAFAEGITDSNGTVTLEAMGYADNCQATVEVWYMMNSTSGTVNFDRGSQCWVDFIISNPFDCTVKGKVVNENNEPVSDLLVWTYASSSQAGHVYNYGMTDSNGVFSIPIACNAEGWVYAKWKFKTYNVNGSKDYDEVSDSGTVADVGTIQIVNDPPVSQVYKQSTSPQVGNPITIGVCAWDMEGNYPLSYEIKVNGTSIASGSDWDISTACRDFVYDLNAAGQYCFEAYFTDSTGKGAPSGSSYCINIDNSNHYIDLTTMGTGYYWNIDILGYTVEEVNLWILASAMDSNTLHNPSVDSINYTCSETDSGSLTPSAWGNTLCSSPACNATIDVNTRWCDFTISATDGTLSINHTKRIQVFGR